MTLVTFYTSTLSLLLCWMEISSTETRDLWVFFKWYKIKKTKCPYSQLISSSQSQNFQNSYYQMLLNFILIFFSSNLLKQKLAHRILELAQRKQKNTWKTSVLKYERKRWFAKLVGLMLIQSLKLWDLTTHNSKRAKLV